MLCKNCNTEMPYNAKFCGICGSKLEPEAAAQAQNLERTHDIANNPKHTPSSSISDEELEQFMRKWNWGAFSFTWIWGIFNKSYNTFISLIPILGVIYSFVCGAKGNRWAWKKKEWISKDAFVKAQRKWNRWGITVLAIFILCIILESGLALLGDQNSPTSAPNSSITQQENNTQQNNDTSTIIDDKSINDTVSNLTDQVRNAIDINNEYVQGVKNACPDQYPEKTYGDAFDAFFKKPAWKYFDATTGEKVVEFSGFCMYQNVEVKAVFQFVISEDEQTFTAGALSFNDVPQNRLTTAALLEKVFSDSGSDSTGTETNSQ